MVALILFFEKLELGFVLIEQLLLALCEQSKKWLQVVIRYESKKMRLILIKALFFVVTTKHFKLYFVLDFVSS